MNAFLAEKFKQNLYESLNNSNLSLPTAYYIFKEVYEDLSKNYYEAAQIAPEEEECEMKISPNEINNNVEIVEEKEES